MTFGEFVNAVEKGVSETMGDGYDVSVKKVQKNNGLTLTGLLIAEKDSKVAPAIYLDSFYEPYICKGMGLESVIEYDFIPDSLIIHHGCLLGAWEGTKAVLQMV